MNHSNKVKLLAKQMMDNMTEQEKEFLLFINLCDMLSIDEELLQDNEELMPMDGVDDIMEDIFPATYNRIKKDLN